MPNMPLRYYISSLLVFVFCRGYSDCEINSLRFEELWEFPEQCAGEDRWLYAAFELMIIKISLSDESIDQ